MRKIVLATNIAETSITINDVVFVIDCGKAKETSYDALNNTSCLLPSWISKVSAQQVRSLFYISIQTFLSPSRKVYFHLLWVYMVYCYSFVYVLPSISSVDFFFFFSGLGNR